jgi:predicted secreted hydrolase
MADDGFSQALAPRQWAFPRDHGRHDGFKTEWWYFTGNLRDDAGGRFGYQLTFFRTALAPAAADRASPWGMNDLYFAHAAVTDLGGRRFVFDDALQRGRPGLAWAAEDRLDVRLLNWNCVGDASGIHLLADSGQFGIHLNCVDGRGPVLEGPGGVNAKGREPGQASYYYSMTRLKTSGALVVGGKTYHVTGLSWMDHEFSSNSLGKDQVGWDWMGLQLDDGSDLMVYRLRRGDGGTDYLSGTHIGEDGKPVYLTDRDIQISGSAPWKSETSGGVYPQTWSLKITGMPDMIVTSQMPGQELVTTDSTNVNYFEGAADVTDTGGKPMGQGYLEMTGYAGSVQGSNP